MFFPSLDHEGNITAPAVQVRIESVVEEYRWAGLRSPYSVRLREGFSESVHLVGHFRVPLQDVTEPLVCEPNLVSVLIDKSPHVDLQYQIPYRKVYRLMEWRDKRLVPKVQVY